MGYIANSKPPGVRAMCAPLRVRPPRDLLRTGGLPADAQLPAGAEAWEEAGDRGGGSGWLGGRAGGKWAGAPRPSQVGKALALRAIDRPGPGPRRPGVPPAPRRVYLSLGVSGGSSRGHRRPDPLPPPSSPSPPRPGFTRAARPRPSLLPPATQPY